MTPTRTLSPGLARTLAAVAVGVGIACWSASGLVERAATVFSAGGPANSYFVPSRALLLYLGVPLATTLAVATAMAPAFLLVAAWGRARSATEWAATALVVAFAVNGVGLAVANAVGGFSMDPTAGRVGLLALTVIAGVTLVVRAHRTALPLPGTTTDLRRAVWTVAIPVVLTIGLLPVLLWQDFNPDGLEALSMGRSLGAHVLPRLPTGYASGLSLGMVTSSYPVSWFVTWFGPTEIAARAPLLMYAPLLFLIVLGCAEHDRSRRATFGEEAALFLGVLGFLVALAYNNSYHPYFADIASPANLDILAVTLMAAIVYFHWTDRPALLVATALLATFNRPTGVLFLGLLVIGASISRRPSGVRDLVGRVGPLVIAAIACVAAGAVYERLVVPTLGIPLEDPGAQIGWRLRYFTVDDIGRLAYLVLPSGVVPAVALFAWPKLDPRARALSVAVLGYFVFFYLRAFVALHHFAPAMLLPLVVLWRWALDARPDRRRTAAVAAVAALAVLSSLPRNLDVHRTMRGVGAATVYEPGDYLGSWTELRDAFEAKDVLDSIFRPYWDVPDPGAELIGAPWVQVHYASTAPPDDSPRYLVTSAGAPSSGRWLDVAGTEGTAFVADSSSWAADRSTAPTTDFASRWYAIDRETLFPRLGIPAGNYSFDLREVLLGGRTGGAP